MKRLIIACTVLASMASNAFAGGLLTNTNQSASFDRMMAQNALIDITALNANPAGTAFLSNGWHLALNTQTAMQTRSIDTTFPLFALNTQNPNPKHSFEGKAFAPVIPSFQLSYNHDKWSVNANFALIGGGGKCEFKDGLGSFEALYAGQLYQQVPVAVNAQLSQILPVQISAGLKDAGIPAAMADPLAATETHQTQMTGYSLNPYMKGRQYYFGLTLGGTYKITDYLAVYAGVRAVYASCNYNGYVQDVKANYAYSYSVAQANINGNGTGALDLNDNSLTLNADQTGFAITPIIGFDCKINDQWNVAVKYEMTTNMTLKNSSEMNEFAQVQAAANPTLGQFADGSKIREDIPGILSAGVQYSPIEAVRINAGMNAYFDKNAKKFGGKHNLIDKNTMEYLAGVEYDVCKLITVSAAWQNTTYGLSDAYMNDLSFTTSSNSIGCGLRINATKRCSIDLGYMHTMYGKRTVETATAAGAKVDEYTRTSNVIGAGVSLHF